MCRRLGEAGEISGFHSTISHILRTQSGFLCFCPCMLECAQVVFEWGTGQVAGQAHFKKERITRRNLRSSFEFVPFQSCNFCCHLCLPVLRGFCCHCKKDGSILKCICGSSSFNGFEQSLASKPRALSFLVPQV